MRLLPVIAIAVTSAMSAPVLQAEKADLSSYPGALAMVQTGTTHVTIAPRGTVASSMLDFDNIDMEEDLLAFVTTAAQKAQLQQLETAYQLAHTQMQAKIAIKRQAVLQAGSEQLQKLEERVVAASKKVEDIDQRMANLLASALMSRLNLELERHQLDKVLSSAQQDLRALQEFEIQRVHLVDQEYQEWQRQLDKTFEDYVQSILEGQHVKFSFSEN